MEEPASAGRLRLLFWNVKGLQKASEDKYWQDHVWSIANRLVEELRTFVDAAIDNESWKNEWDEKKDERSYEIALWIGHDNLPQVFADVTNTAIWYLSQECDKTPLKFAIVAASREFYERKFRATDVVPVHSAYFGNVRNKTQFLIHRQIEPRGQQHILDRYFRRDSGQNSTSFDTSSRLAVDFAHDRREMRLVFPDLWDSNRSGKPEREHYIFTLLIRYRSIRQILVDANINEDGTLFLRLYLNLSCPPIVNRIKVFADDRGYDLRTSKKARYRSCDMAFNEQRSRELNESPYFRIDFDNIEPSLYGSILDRLSLYAEVFPEFRVLNSQKWPFRDYQPYEMNKAEFRQALSLKDDDFPLIYMIEALVSRGAVFNDYFLLVPGYRDKFINMLVRHYRLDDKRTLTALEMLLHHLDEDAEPGDPRKAFQWFYQKLASTPQEIHTYDEEDDEGYIRLRKVIVTPTRILFMAPELIMGNRALRIDEDYPPESFLRIVFRDDDCTTVYSNKATPKLIEIFVKGRLEQGITIGGCEFNFLGSSNSQLRDNGCYFLRASPEECMQFLRNVGEFDFEGIAKMMSRVAQVFTQAQEVDVGLHRSHYVNRDDYLLGGSNRKGELYVFSDGVGCFSKRIAKQISQGLELENHYIPSCFQFRFRGYKGVLTLDPTLDARRLWGVKNGVVDDETLDKDERWVALDLVFRTSQNKFYGPTSTAIDVVKYSVPTTVALNRPLINILDQITSMQSRERHRRIAARIHSLLDGQLHRLTRAMIDEKAARNRMSDFPKLILYEKVTDIQMTREPFFRSLLLESTRASLKKLRIKLQIQVPADLGRCMFGVVDESGELQYGQVFLRYTANVRHRRPGEKHCRIIHTGPVLVTKNPMTVGGDVRILEAVDVPALHHLSDVIVFPRYGPRPHPDEMAGSDLDGDEYTVIWDDELFFTRNEPAFDYTPRPPAPAQEDEEALRQEMTQFYVDYVSQDSIGLIGSAFLINSDMYGIKHEVCNRIALKHMFALDFCKTGDPPEALTNRWDEDIPQERWERAPDFMEKNTHPSYVSRRLNGQLFRRVKRIDDIMTLVSGETNASLVPVDPLFELRNADGTPVLYVQNEDSILTSEECLDIALEHYNAYASGIQNIMDTYGVKTEGELFSASFVSLRNRMCEKENDSMSKYTTDEIIERQLSQWFARFRQTFFKTFGDKFEDITSLEGRYAGSGVKEVFRRTCSEPSAKLKLLASAYYKLVYDAPVRRFLSFPWLAWDVLNAIRKYNLCHAADKSLRFSPDPICDELTQHMLVFFDDLESEMNFEEFNQLVAACAKDGSAESHGWRVVKNYCYRHAGLDQLMFYIVLWGRSERLFTDNGRPGIAELHICLLLIQFGLGLLPADALGPVGQWLEQTDTEVTGNDFWSINLIEQAGGLGKKLMAFFEFLASRYFQQLTRIDFSKPHAECRYHLQNGEWQPLHKLALETYHRVAFTGKFTRLPCTEEQLQEESTFESAPPEAEAEPFVIEVPERGYDRMVDHQAELVRRLKAKTGCSHIVYRDLPLRHGQSTTKVIISAKGTITAVTALRDLLSVEAPKVTFKDGDSAAAYMANQYYEKLVELMPSFQLP